MVSGGYSLPSNTSVDDTSIELDGSGNLSVKDGGVTSAMLEAGSLKETLRDHTQLASSNADSVTSATYTDTDLAVTLTGMTASKTYTIKAYATFDLEQYTIGQQVVAGMNMAGTIKQETRARDNTNTRCIYPTSLAAHVSGVTGVTSYIAKVQILASSGTVTRNANADRIHSIYIEAQEE